MTDLVLAGSLEERINYAKALAASDLLPQAYRGKPANVMIALELGNALGIAPTTALYGINVIQGKPTLGAETMRAVVLAHGHRFDVIAFSDTEAVVRVARRERPEDTSDFSFTIADARRAGLAGGNYDKYPKAMLLARATTQACRAIFPDVLAGVSYAPEELEPVVVAETARPRAMARILTEEPTEEDWDDLRADLVVEVNAAGDAAFGLEPEPEAVPVAVVAEPTIEEVVDHVTKTRAYNLMRQAGYTGRRQMVDFVAVTLARDPGRLDLSSLTTADFEAICEALAPRPAEVEEPEDVEALALAYEEGR